MQDGLMTDWGVHLIDYILYGMGKSLPKSVMAIGGKYAFPMMTWLLLIQ